MPHLLCRANIALTVEQAVYYYEYSRVNISGPGMYRFLSASGWFMVFLEAFYRKGHSTVLSELGSRHTDVEVTATSNNISM